MDTDRPSRPHSVAAIQAGQEALARGAWEEARSVFERALRADESPEAFEGLGVATWWLEDDAATIDARRRAYRLYLDRGDRSGAARVATGLTLDHFFHSDRAVANGWVQRAHRLLESFEQSPEIGWLAIVEAHMALMADHDPATAQRISAQAASLGRALGDTNLEMLALAFEGLALVSQGKIDEGMRRLDESTTAAVAGEMSDIDATAKSCCCLIYACERVRDFHRASQWCRIVEQFSERWSYRMMFSICRVHYAGILMSRGEWAEAEAELEASIRALETTRLAQAAEGLMKLAELRRRQGHFDEAAMLLERANSHPFRVLAGDLTLLGQAALALDQNDAETAVDLAEGFLRAITDEDRMERAAGLELLVRAYLALGDRAEAEKALAEFHSVANAVGTEAMRGSTRFAEGLVAAAAGDHKSAKGHFEDATYLYDHCGAPFETPCARLELARSLLALDRPDTAELQARNALEAFQGLGAAAEADHAAALLRELETISRGRISNATNPSGLTRREIEVLRLVAQGLSDKEIADQLVLSRHTVHRHMSSILTKLDLPSRTAAAAYAAHHNLF
jgi:LuxR family maltose regulon positive regulatory protein